MELSHEDVMLLAGGVFALVVAVPGVSALGLHFEVSTVPLASFPPFSR